MTHAQADKNRWKRDQLRHFRAYLTAFELHSREHALIMESISRLENSL